MANRRGKGGSSEISSSLGSKVTADGDSSHEIRGYLLLGRKAMINLDSVLKSKHHFVDKGLYSESYGFSKSHVKM